MLPKRCGLGLKSEHFRDVLECAPDLGFFEIHAENYMVDGGAYHHNLTKIREHYPLSIHGVGLSIGSEDALDAAHLQRLKALIDRYEPRMFSEHLAWSTHRGVFFNDLLPMPYDQAALTRVCEHIDEVQTYLQRPMLLENPATYVEFAGSSMTEPDFISEIIKRTGCGLLLDVNNVYVSCINHGRDPKTTLDAMPLSAVGQIHLAGFASEQDSLEGALLIDSHGSPVADAVWALYAHALTRTGAVGTLLERDSDIPPLSVLLAETARADQLLLNALQVEMREPTAENVQLI